MSQLVLTLVAGVSATVSRMTFKVLRKLGAGKFGAVYELISDAFEGPLACKELPNTKAGRLDYKQVILRHSSEIYFLLDAQSNITYDLTLQELAMLREVGNHPNINRLQGSGQTKKGSFLLLDMCHGGTLEDLVLKQKGLPERQAAMFTAKLLDTTQYMHHKGLLPYF